MQTVFQVDPFFDWKAYLVYGILSCLFATWIATTVTAQLIIQRQHNGKRPPTVPHCMPFLGSVMPFIRDPEGFIATWVHRFGYSTPFRIRLGSLTLFVASGIEHTNAILKASRKMTTTPGTVYALRNLLGTPKHIIPFYLADNSGIGTLSRPESSVRPEHRIIYLQHHAAHIYLSGLSLAEMNQRYLSTLGRNLSARSIGEEWIELPDLYEFLQHEVFRAAVEAMCGSFVLSLNPTLVEDFWNYDASIPSLVKGYPRWLAFNAHKARDKMLKSVKRWHGFANQFADCTKTGPNDPEWDPCWGSKLVKARQSYCLATGVMDADAIASEDLGLMFAQNTNAIPAIFWLFLYTLQDPSLLTRVLRSIDTSQASVNPGLDMNGVYENPLLLSMYAETLRLRVGILVTRNPEFEDFQLGQWKYPKGEMIGLFSRTAALDKEAWTTGNPEGSHPLEEFWAERFLVYPNDPTSGPARKTPLSKKQQTTSETIDPLLEPKFTLEGLSGAWIPYGGGRRMCPGRHFAKQEIIGTFVLMCTTYDIEVLSWNKSSWPKPDMRYYPLGGLPPDRRLPVRIRRRAKI